MTSEDISEINSQIFIFLTILKNGSDVVPPGF